MIPRNVSYDPATAALATPAPRPTPDDDAPGRSLTEPSQPATDSE